MRLYMLHSIIMTNRDIVQNGDNIYDRARRDAYTAALASSGEKIDMSEM